MKGVCLSDLQFGKYLLEVTKDQEIKLNTRKDKSTTIRTKNKTQSMQLQSSNMNTIKLTLLCNHLVQEVMALMGFKGNLDVETCT